MDSGFVVGTAGWVVPTALAEQCPGPGPHLRRYAERLDGVEINSSFYRPHRRATYERWAATVPDAFRFAVKLPKAVTHEARLVDCGALLDRFAVEVGGLGTKLGPLLVQLPPSLAFEADVAHAFFHMLRDRIEAALVCEPRHASWFTDEAEALLTAWQVARVAADPAPVAGAEQPGGWDGLAYVRLHGSPRIYYSDYGPEALAGIARDLAAYGADGKPVWCIFDNTAAGHALGNALTLAGRFSS